MSVRVETPSRNRIDELVRLCEAHAIFEQSEYSANGKAKSLIRDIFEDNPKLHCRVAIVDDIYVGYITWMSQYSTWDACEYVYMDCIYLEAEYRSKGIGVKLMDEMKSFGKERGIDVIQWQTPDFNARAIKFYKRIGATSKSKERFFLSIG